MGKKWVKTTFFQLFVENRPHLKLNFTECELLIFSSILASTKTSQENSNTAMTAVVSVSPTKIDVLAVTRVKSYSGAKIITFFAATDSAVI